MDMVRLSIICTMFTEAQCIAWPSIRLANWRCLPARTRRYVLGTWWRQRQHTWPTSNTVGLTSLLSESQHRWLWKGKPALWEITFVTRFLPSENKVYTYISRGIISHKLVIWINVIRLYDICTFCFFNRLAPGRPLSAGKNTSYFPSRPRSAGSRQFEVGSLKYFS